MSKTLLNLSLLTSLSLFTAFLKADDCSNCELGPRPMHASIKHIEGNGIGYNQGYSSLDLFLGKDFDTYLPFLDLRGHIFNDGKWAANAGIGIRTLLGERVYGLEAYYDYREANHLKNINQAGVSLESLGTVWDFRANGYIPFGNRSSHFYGQEFGGFEGHHLLVKRKQKFAMRGVDAEVGAHFESYSEIDFYAGIGPYYFNGKEVNAYGGKFRLEGNYKQFITLELSTSYDNVFKDIYQAQVALSLPFGGRKPLYQKECGPSCCDLKLLKRRMVEPVIRNEIIVVDSRRKNFVAIDPSTGLPFNFIFVNNLSSSLGTFESPYPTIIQAIDASIAHDIIYIFPGDRTTRGYTAVGSAYALKDHQQVLGASRAYTFETNFGSVTVPALAITMPQITADPGLSVFDLANNNILSGLHITSDASGAISGTYSIGSTAASTSGITISYNEIVALNGADGAAIANPSLQIAFLNNIVNSPDLAGAVGLNLQPENQTLSVSIANNTFSGFQNPGAAINGGTGIFFEPSGTTHATISIIKNQITANTQGLEIHSFDTATATANVNSNTNLANAFGIYIAAEDASSIVGEVSSNKSNDNTNAGIFFNAFTSGKLNFSILKNEASNNNFMMAGDGINAVILDTSTANFTISSNTTNGNGRDGIRLRSIGSSVLTAVIGNNIAQNNGLEGIGTIAQGTSSLDATAESNTLSENGVQGLLMQTQNSSTGSFRALSNTFSSNNGVSAFIQSSATSSLCIKFLNNMAVEPYTFSKAGGSTFNISGNSGNTPANPTPPVGSGVCSN